MPATKRHARGAPDARKLHPNTIYLRAAMAKAGISHKQAGALVGRKAQSITKYACETEGRVIPDALLEKLDDALCNDEHLKFRPKLKFLESTA